MVQASGHVASVGGLVVVHNAWSTDVSFTRTYVIAQSSAHAERHGTATMPKLLLGRSFLWGGKTTCRKIGRKQ